jgi:hypothetical protein
MAKKLVALTDNELSMIEDALRFQMQYFFDQVDMGLVERTYALRLGEIVDQISRHIKTTEENNA